MKNRIEESLELAKANISIALQHMDDTTMMYNHTSRAIRTLKEVEYLLWRESHTSGGMNTEIAGITDT